jgi:hypothetical protein
MVGQLTLDQHIGVRIPGGQPNLRTHYFIKRLGLVNVQLKAPTGTRMGSPNGEARIA